MVTGQILIKFNDDADIGIEISGDIPHRKFNALPNKLKRSLRVHRAILYKASAAEAMETRRQKILERETETARIRADAEAAAALEHTITPDPVNDDNKNFKLEDTELLENLNDDLVIDNEEANETTESEDITNANDEERNAGTVEGSGYSISPE